MASILAVDDEVGILDMIQSILSKDGHSVTGITNPVEINYTKVSFFDLILLDIMMPGIDGFTLCKKLRNQVDCPIVFLTAKSEENSLVNGLSLGADDYISKPFRVKELLARIKTVLRRYNKDTADGIIDIGSIKINTNEAKVYNNGREIILTAMEYRLLLTFVNNRGVILTRQKLLEDIWDVAGDFVNDNTLTVYIKRLRDKIEEDPADPAIIKTVRGLGYILEK